MQVHIVHGFDASPAHHWFPWLKQALEHKGHHASVTNLPASHAPTPQAWVQALQEQVPSPDRHTWFVSHSLGGIALLRYLERLPAGAAIGGYVLVSGFNAPLVSLPQLEPFAKPDLDVRRLSSIAAHRSVIASADDYAVPPELSKALADELQASYQVVERGGHFLDSEGFTEFPLVLDELDGAFRTSNTSSAASR